MVTTLVCSGSGWCVDDGGSATEMLSGLVAIASVSMRKMRRIVIMSIIAVRFSDEIESPSGTRRTALRMTARASLTVKAILDRSPRRGLCGARLLCRGPEDLVDWWRRAPPSPRVAHY